MIRRCLCLILIAGVTACAPEADPVPREEVRAVAPGTIIGRVRVVDGDTLYVDGVKIRLNGIDAPERGSPFFAAATAALRREVAGGVVLCHPDGARSYDRLVARCFVDGADIAAGVIASGAALDCARYSGGRYRRFERAEARRRLPQAGYC